MREEFLRGGGQSKYLACGGSVNYLLATLLFEGVNTTRPSPTLQDIWEPNCSSLNILKPQAIGFSFRGVSKNVQSYPDINRGIFNCVWTFFNKIVGQFWYCRGGWCRVWIVYGVWCSETIRQIPDIVPSSELLRVCPGVRSPLSPPSCYRTHLTQLPL